MSLAEHQRGRRGRRVRRRGARRGAPTHRRQRDRRRRVDARARGGESRGGQPAARLREPRGAPRRSVGRRRPRGDPESRTRRAGPRRARCGQARRLREAARPDDRRDGRPAPRAETSGLVHAVCFNIRFYPLCHQMRAMVASGAIGEPRLVSGSYLQDWLLLPTDWNWRLEPEKAGALRAIGRHRITLARPGSLRYRAARRPR